MPPKPKFTKEQIINAGFEIAREKGIEAVVAREVGKRLGASQSPIFTVWNSMEGLQAEVFLKTIRHYKDYIKQADKYNPAFKKRGMLMIKYASENPNLFRLLFMRKQRDGDIDSFMSFSMTGFEDDVLYLQNEYKLSEDKIKKLFNHMWIYTYGICVLCVTSSFKFNDEQISQMLGENFASILIYLKNDMDLNIKVIPAGKNTDKGKKMSEGLPV